MRNHHLENGRPRKLPELNTDTSAKMLEPPFSSTMSSEMWKSCPRAPIAVVTVTRQHRPGLPHATFSHAPRVTQWNISNT
eukprot:642979-Amphidinium_carterae.1